jgi:hypothetical protein
MPKTVSTPHATMVSAMTWLTVQLERLGLGREISTWPSCSRTSRVSAACSLPRPLPVSRSKS